MSGEAAPLVKTFDQRVEAVAASADSVDQICEAPFAGTVTEVTYTPDAAVTGANTETRTLVLVNRGQAGAGTTVVATLALVSGVNLVLGDEKDIPVSVVAGATTVAAGDELRWESTHSGATGLADPGGLVQIKISRTGGS